MSNISSPPSSFIYPEYYSYPPFFTLQPVLMNREKQVNLWIELILSYLNNTNKLYISIDENIFYNKDINRKLKLESIEYIIKELIVRGYGIKIDNKKTYISNKTCKEWSELIYEWALNLNVSSIYTLYELQNGIDTNTTLFHNLELKMLILAIKELEINNKCVIMMSDIEDEIGVKFIIKN